MLSSAKSTFSSPRPRKGNPCLAKKLYCMKWRISLFSCSWSTWSLRSPWSGFWKLCETNKPFRQHCNALNSHVCLEHPPYQGLYCMVLYGRNAKTTGLLASVPPLASYSGNIIQKWQKPPSSTLLHEGHGNWWSQWCWKCIFHDFPCLETVCECRTSEGAGL